MKTKKFVNVFLHVLEEDFEVAYGILINFDFIGMEEDFDLLILSFEENKWTEETKTLLISQLNQTLPNAKFIKEEIIEEKNWIQDWEKSVQPIKISEKIYITPEWKQDEINSELKILINPKMSFGTGQHTTTKLMAQLVEKIVKPEQTWIDAGTGTGVLAILAAKLGAKKVYAFDNDEWAYENTLENIKLNNVSEKIEMTLSGIDEYVFPKSDVIAANMFLNLIISSFPKFYASLNHKGLLLVSGILIYDREELLSSAQKNNFELKEDFQEEEWCCFLFEKI